MSAFSDDDASRLLELLKNEMEVFSAILKLIEKQAESIEADDIYAFGKMLDRTQEYIEIINGLHDESSALMQIYASYVDSAGEDKNTGIDEASDMLRSVIEECAELNDKNAIAADERNQDYIERISKLNLSRKSLGSYMQNVTNAPEMFDKKL